MTLHRRRDEFWGSGPAARQAAGFSFHRLHANAPEEEVESHTHEEAHFVLVLSGGYMSSARGAPEVSAGPLLVFNPAGVTHADRFHQGRGGFLAVSGGSEQGDGCASAVRDPYAIWSAQSIAHDLTLQPDVLVLEGRALQLLASVRTPGSDEAPGARRPPSWLKRVFELTFTSDDPDLSVADLAACAGVHPVHLARVFQRYLGCSPGERLRGRRLERAAAMLGSKPLASLAEAAAACGFVDQAHMTRAFGSAFGSTPAAWRRRGAPPAPGEH